MVKLSTLICVLHFRLCSRKILRFLRKGTFINHMSMVIGREGSSEMLKICSEQGGRGPVKCSEFAQTKKLEQKIAFYSH